MASPPVLPKTTKRGGGGFSLAMMFVLITAFASLMPLVAPTIEALVKGPRQVGGVAVAMVIVGIISAMVGLVMGLYRYDRKDAIPLAGIGFWIGMMITPIAFMRGAAVIPATISLLTGSVIIVLFSAIARSRSEAKS